MVVDYLWYYDLCRLLRVQSYITVWVVASKFIFTTYLLGLPGRKTIFLSIHPPHLHLSFSSSYWTLVFHVSLSITVARCDVCSSDQRFASTFLQIPPQGAPQKKNHHFWWFFSLHIFKTTHCIIHHFWLSPRPISNNQLHMLPYFHLCPIYLVVFKGSY